MPRGDLTSLDAILEVGPCQYFTLFGHSLPR